VQDWAKKGLLFPCVHNAGLDREGKDVFLHNLAPPNEDIQGRGGSVLCIFNLGTRGGEWSASCSSCFTTRERTGTPQYPWNRRLCGLQSQSGHSDKSYTYMCNVILTGFISNS